MFSPFTKLNFSYVQSHVNFKGLGARVNMERFGKRKIRIFSENLQNREGLLTFSEKQVCLDHLSGYTWELKPPPIKIGNKKLDKTTWRHKNDYNCHYPVDIVIQRKIVLLFSLEKWFLKLFKLRSHIFGYLCTNHEFEFIIELIFPNKQCHSFRWFISKIIVRDRGKKCVITVTILYLYSYANQSLCVKV